MGLSILSPEAAACRIRAPGKSKIEWAREHDQPAILT
jgi:hypothetical protein